jgi:hypothetical protein
MTMNGVLTAVAAVILLGVAAAVAIPAADYAVTWWGILLW